MKPANNTSLLLDPPQTSAFDHVFPGQTYLYTPFARLTPLTDLVPHISQNTCPHVPLANTQHRVYLNIR